MADRRGTIADPRSMSGACHKCVHRRDLPGNAHSACHHPAVAKAHENELASLIAAWGALLPMPPPPDLRVAFDAHGIGMGWASWPFNFDPVWLVSCNGFTPSEEGR